MRPVAAAVVAILLLACGALTEPVASTVLFPGLARRRADGICVGRPMLSS